jgi:uncharacterized protein involved in cysteine biosynthesis
MIGFLKTILILALIYYGIKFLSPWIKRFFMRKLSEKIEKHMQGGFGQETQGRSTAQDSRKEGEVKVEKMRNTRSNPSNVKKVNTDNLGDYIDFEEVKEE